MPGTSAESVIVIYLLGSINETCRFGESSPPVYGEIEPFGRWTVRPPGRRMPLSCSSGVESGHSVPVRENLRNFSDGGKKFLLPVFESVKFAGVSGMPERRFRGHRPAQPCLSSSLRAYPVFHHVVSDGFAPPDYGCSPWREEFVAHEFQEVSLGRSRFELGRRSLGTCGRRSCRLGHQD
jgi:hypothetical protein